MKKIVILGNGFDLAHNLETKYDHFIKYIIEQSINYNFDVRKNIIDVGELNSELQSFEYISQNLNNLLKFSSRYGQIKFPNIFFKQLIIRFFSSDWFDIESFYFHILTLTKSDAIEKLQKDFETIKTFLKNYLEKIYEESNPIFIPQFMNIFNEEHPNTLVFLNFNYTPTIHQYFNKLSIKSKSIINIHGDLYKKDIVFGYGNEYSDKYQDLIQKPNKRYLRNLKGQQYNLTTEYSEIMGILNQGDKITVYTIGHSLGITDKTLLKDVFDHPNVIKIKMFHYSDLEGFRSLNDNLVEIVEPITFKSKVIPFDEENRIPQVTD